MLVSKSSYAQGSSKVRCILQISSMILRMCAVKKLACRTALYVCVTNLNEFKGLKTSFLE